MQVKARLNERCFIFLQSIQIKILLGHSAQWRKKPTPEGFTHDWKMVVQGEEGQEIKHFVEKVVFHLHESFPRPKRGTVCIYFACSHEMCFIFGISIQRTSL